MALEHALLLLPGLAVGRELQDPGVGGCCLLLAVAPEQQLQATSGGRVVEVRWAVSRQA